MTRGSAVFRRSTRYLRMRSIAATLRVWMASNWPWLNLAGRPEASIAVSKAASVQPVAAAAAVAPAGAELPASGAALGLVGSAAVCDAAGSALGPHAARPAAAT